MKIRYPEYYKKFRCIAGDCPDTCCAGWEIAVDRASEKRYRDAQRTMENREFAKKLKKHVKNGHIISERTTCPFLNTDGLCEMYIEMGPESLCHTCARHPRHMEDYGNLHEMVLLLSCPEAARLILEENSGEFYVREIPEKCGNMDGVDEELLNLLLQTRDMVWKITENIKLSVDIRMMMAVALVHDVQRRISNNERNGITAVLARYGQADAAVRFVRQWWQREKWKHGAGDEGLGTAGESIDRFLLMSDFMEELAGLEIVCIGWPDMLEKCRTKLYHSADSREKYAKRRKRFLEKQGPAYAAGDSQCLFQYFTYSFFIAALYDGDALTKIKMAVLCTMAIEELYMAQMDDAAEPGIAENHVATQTIQERVHICHTLARQIENSDGNRGALEQILKQEIFCARRIINSLIGSLDGMISGGGDSK